MPVELLSALDTFIYAGLVLVVWNFYWTRKQKDKIFGDDKDDTSTGLLKDVQDLEEQLCELKHNQCCCCDECN